MYINTCDNKGRGTPDTERKAYRTRKDYLGKFCSDAAFKKLNELSRRERRIQALKRKGII